MLFKIVIDKRSILLDVDSEKSSKVPDYIFFLLLIDPTYPDQPPKILTKSNVNTFLLSHSSISSVLQA